VEKGLIVTKFQKMDLLVAVYIFCVAASELMGIKTFQLFNFSWLHLNASVGIFLVPVIYSINDVITEVFGRERARSLIRSALVVVAFCFLFAALATALPASHRFTPMESAYDTIFHSTLRIAGASLIAFALAEFTDVFVFVKVREKLGKQGLWLRNNASNFVAQLLDTTIFITSAFWALDKPLGDNVSFLIGLIIPYWLLKCAMSVIETPFVYAGVKWLKDK